MDAKKPVPHEILFVFQKFILITLFSSVCTVISKSEENHLIQKQIHDAEFHENFSEPTVGEFFLAVDHQINPSWSLFIPPPISTNTDSRSVLAFQLGIWLSDCILAILSKETQQLKNALKETKLIAEKLNLEQAILPRLNSISNFCENKNWHSLHEELDAIRSEILIEIKKKNDDELFDFIDFGAWVRAFQTVSEIVLSSDKLEKTICFRKSEIYYIFNFNSNKKNLDSQEIFIQKAEKYRKQIQTTLRNSTLEKQDVEYVNQLIKNLIEEAQRRKTSS